MFAALTLTYIVVDTTDENTVTICLNDQPLPVGTLSIPTAINGNYPIGSVMTYTMQTLGPSDRAWIIVALQTPVTLTIPTWTRATGTGTLTGLIVQVTLTQPCLANPPDTLFGYF